MTKRAVIIGAHVSAAGGLANAIENAKRIGADAIQMFGSSPRQWKVSMPSDESVASYHAAYRDSGLGPTVLHAPYLANLASSDAELRKRSIELLAGNLAVAERIGALGLIFHLGSGKELARGTAIEFLVDGVNAVLKATPGRALLMLENSAGGGDKLGNTIPEMGAIIQKTASPRVAFCFDTAHAFEAGSIAAYTPETVEAMAGAITSAIGWERLVALHVNDSKTVWNSHNDRHENIGKGYIGLEGFRVLMHSKFAEVPWYLEVPGFDGTGPDAKNVKTLRNLL